MIVKLSNHQDFRRSNRRTRLYDLGEHLLAEGPGLAWATNYWVKSFPKDGKWELFSSEEKSIKCKVSNGLYTAAELIEYFNSVGFDCDTAYLSAIGLVQPAKIINIRELK
jgi:hypothetical protein